MKKSFKNNILLRNNLKNSMLKVYQPLLETNKKKEEIITKLLMK